MVGTILPIVYRERSRGAPPVCLWLYAVGTVCGAIALGLVVSVIGATLRALLSPAAFSGTVLVLALVAHLGWAAAELQLGRIPLPESWWQVPYLWQQRFSPRMFSLLYGVILGLGFFTRVGTATFYVVVMWVTFIGQPWLGGVIFAAYGIGRVLPVLALDRHIEDVQCLAHRSGNVDQWSPAIRLLNGVVLATSGGWLLGLLLS